MNWIVKCIPGRIDSTSMQYETSIEMVSLIFESTAIVNWVIFRDDLPLMCWSVCCWVSHINSEVRYKVERTYAPTFALYITATILWWVTHIYWTVTTVSESTLFEVYKSMVSSWLICQWTYITSPMNLIVEWENSEKYSSLL